jgi:hypothetical protein
LKPSENLKNRLEFSFKEAYDLKSFKKYLENTIHNYEYGHDGNREYYTKEDYKLLLILVNSLEQVI